MNLHTPHLIGQHFSFALGRLGILEKELLQETDIDRLLGAPNPESAVKMLRDIEFVATPETEESFLDTLDATAKKLKNEVKMMAPKEKYFIFDILWLDGDRAILSYALKERNGFTSSISRKPLPPVFAWSDDDWEEELLELLANSNPLSSPEEIDDVVSAYINDIKRNLAKRSGSGLIRSYVDRLLALAEDQKTHRQSHEENTDSLEREKETLESLRALLWQMRQIILGPEALFAYAIRAQMQIALLKVLLTGKVNNLPIQEIKSLLPPLL